MMFERNVSHVFLREAVNTTVYTMNNRSNKVLVRYLINFGLDIHLLWNTFKSLEVNDTSKEGMI